MTLVGLTALSVEISTKVSQADCLGGQTQSSGSQHIVAHGLARLALQQGHVLIGGGVEHDLRAMLV